MLQIKLYSSDDIGYVQFSIWLLMEPIVLECHTIKFASGREIYEYVLGIYKWSEVGFLLSLLFDWFFGLSSIKTAEKSSFSRFLPGIWSHIGHCFEVWFCFGNHLKLFVVRPSSTPVLCHPFENSCWGRVLPLVFYKRLSCFNKVLFGSDFILFSVLDLLFRHNRSTKLGRTIAAFLPLFCFSPMLQ